MMFRVIIRKRADKASDNLNSLIRGFESHFEWLPEPILAVSIDMRVIYANTIMRDLISINRKHSTGQRDFAGVYVNDLLCTDISGNPATVRAFNAGTPQSGEVILEFNGLPIDFMYSCIPYYAYGSGGAVLLFEASLIQIQKLRIELGKLTSEIQNSMNLSREKYK